MEWQFDAEDARIALAARRSFANLLQETCTEQSDIGGAETSFGELVGNVVRHAPGPVRIAMRSGVLGRVTLNVYDTGAPFTIRASLPETYSESGRGLYIVSEICSHVSVVRVRGGNKVTAVLPVTAGQTEHRIELAEPPELTHAIAELVIRLKNGEIVRENIKTREIQMKRAQFRKRSIGGGIVLGGRRLDRTDIEAIEVRA